MSVCYRIPSIKEYPQRGMKVFLFKNKMQISGSSWYIPQITTQPLGPSVGETLRMALESGLSSKAMRLPEVEEWGFNCP